MWSQIVTTSLNCLLYPLFNTLAGIVAPCSVNTNGKAIWGVSLAMSSQSVITSLSPLLYQKRTYVFGFEL